MLGKSALNLSIFAIHARDNGSPSLNLETRLVNFPNVPRLLYHPFLTLLNYGFSPIVDLTYRFGHIKRDFFIPLFVDLFLFRERIVLSLRVLGTA